MPLNSNLIFDSYHILTGASPFYQQCWMCDETIFRILNLHYPHLKNAFNFTRAGLNHVLSAKAGPCTRQNPHAIYSTAQFKTDCPYSGDRRKVFYYFRRDRPRRTAGGGAAGRSRGSRYAWSRTARTFTIFPTFVALVTKKTYVECT
jgi:hypothetical protein